MDNLLAGISFLLIMMKEAAEYCLVIPRQKTLKHHHQGVATLTGISGSFEMEWVAAFAWNWWQL
jgi:hypothetical protein